MAIAETAKLAVEIGLTDKLSPGIRKMEGRISGLGNVARRTGKAIGVGLAAGLAAGTAIVAANVRSGIDSLVVLESAVTSVDGAIAQLGLTGKVTGAQVAAWANEIEGATQAAFDDKDIVAATATLIRYGKVTDANLRPAMEVMTDLAAKTGDVSSAATILGKALADPINAAGKLTRAGVVLTAAQKTELAGIFALTEKEVEHWKALRKTDKAKAKAYLASRREAKVTAGQTWLLAQLAKATTGAAAASKGPMADAQATLADVTEDAQRALAEGFLPVLMRVQKGLSKALADPKTLSAIRSFGQGLAGAFDNVVAFAEKVDWGKIGSGLKVAADWGGKFIGAIAQMPPEVLGALIALGGLNKLSGGAVSGVVGELGKGLIKGVLGMNAGVVNINAGVVNGGGGLPGKGGGTPGIPVAGVAAAGILGPGLGMTAAMAAAPIIAFNLIPKLWAELAGVKPEAGVNATSARDPGFQANRQIAALLAGVPKIANNTAQALGVTRDLRGSIESNTASGAERAAAQAAQMAGVKAAALESARAIRAKKWDVDVKVNVPVSIRTTVSVRDHAIAVATNKRYQGSGKVAGIGTG